ncbi:MAG: ABC transporter ATP-binding protein [Acutalibacteraceae bacterium]|nr:ABC transporter ATP-binding protein [Acutalibacteraceae bacterium]
MSKGNYKLEVVGLSKDLKNKRVLNDINFHVNGGEFLSILGPSGCGKTTLLRILIGLLDSNEGKIFKDGVEITNTPSSKRGIGIVFQNYALFENMTVLENVEYALKIKKETKSTARQQALAMLEHLGLSEHIKKKPRELSGGQQQRVAIARTLVLNPDIILFDEPMSALDVDTRINLRQELKKIQKEYKTTMLFITHDQEDAFVLSDRIMVMKEAEIVQLDTPEEIIKNPANDYVRSFVIQNLQAKVDSLAKFVR